MVDQARRVVMACGACYNPHKPCNQFVQEVARNLSVHLPGDAATGLADDMITAFRKHWGPPLTRHQAIINAEKGDFIVAALPSDDFNPRPIMNRHDAEVAISKHFSPVTAGITAPITAHGHVCVVIPGAIGGYPRVFSSSADSQYGRSRGEQPVAGHIFRYDDAVKVKYFSPVHR